MTSYDVPPLEREGERVRVATVAEADLAPYAVAVRHSQKRIERWNPANPSDLEYHLRHQSAVHRTFVVHALAPVGDHGIVGRVNVTNIVRGRAMEATLGYDSYDPYAGQGLFADGLRLVVDLCFTPEPRGLGLHRLIANVQPGNVRSAGLLRRLGFQRRGATPAYLWLSDETGRSAWRDHVAYGVCIEDWPSKPYPPAQRQLPLVVVRSHPDQAHSTAATDVATWIADELGVPHVPSALVRSLGASGVGDLLKACGGVVVSADPRLPAALSDRLETTAVVVEPAQITTRADVVRAALAAGAAACARSGGASYAHPSRLP